MGEDRDCTAVAVRPQAQGQLILGSLNDFLAFGKIMVESGMFPDVKTTAQAVVKMQAGAELGLPPLYSLQHVSITSQGKLTIDAAIMANLIKRSGTYDYQILEHSGERCSIQMLQNGQKLGQPVVFTLDDARRAGLADKDVWKKYPKNLLFARTISNAARWYCPHVIGNAYTPEEMSSAVGVQVQVLDEPAEAPRSQTDAPEPTAAPTPPVSDAPKRLTYADVLAKYEAMTVEAAKLNGDGIKCSWGEANPEWTIKELVHAATTLHERIEAAKLAKSPEATEMAGSEG